MTFIGSYTSGTSGGRGLELAERGADGALTRRRVLDGIADVSFFAWSPDGKFLYLTNENAQGSITAIDVRGEPTVRGSVSSGGAGPTHLTAHPNGKFLLTANYTDGTVAVHRLAPNGTLGENTDLIQHPGAEPHAHQVVVDPSGRWVLAVDLGADSVFIYALRDGRLVENQRLELPAGTGPRHLAFHGDRAYLLNELASNIIVLDFDAQTGRLTAGQVVSSRAPGASGENFPAEIAVSRDGSFVYASNRGDNDIAVFATTPGGLEFRSVTPTGGDWPRFCALDPAESSLYVANQRSGTITRLTRDPGTGSLAPTSDEYACPSVAALTFGR
ncbi:lactonase family protein [Saccharopolyspora halophila]|uniref:Lactonase family protein n=1 Tax=Saccharopolyspora halophila TaxID=405551 RepID=A0ABN3G3H3_9PSEU